MDALSESDIQRILSLVPVEPGVGSETLAEERFERLQCFFARLNAIIDSRFCRMAALREGGAIRVYLNRGENQFFPVYDFVDRGVYPLLEGGERQFVGSWSEGAHWVICDLMGDEQEAVDDGVRSIEALGRIAAALRPERADTAPHPSVDALRSRPEEILAVPVTV
jgi:hypothetical protein